MKTASKGPSCRRQGAQGWSLIEVVIAVALGTAVLASMLPTGITVTRSMLAIQNYCDLNRASCNALDNMSRDLRNTATVTAINNTSVTVSNTLTTDVISYYWDGTDKVIRTLNGKGKVVLTQCDYLQFRSYQRNPTNGFQFTPASSPDTTKLISVSWRCSRKILGSKLNTESVQTARICIRN